ncbi:hypothetical protein Tco_0269010 [Tanacetum coccineum]
MKTLVEKRNASKFCEFYREVGHTTDECMHLKRQIEEMLMERKLSHLIKELKQGNGKDQAKTMAEGVPQPVINQVTQEKIHVAIHSEYLEQTVAIGSTLTEEG